MASPPISRSEPQDVCQMKFIMQKHALKMIEMIRSIDKFITLTIMMA